MSQFSGLRSRVLEAYGAKGTEIEELLLYNRNVFEQTKLRSFPQFPLPEESHIEIWSEYLNHAQKIGVFKTLKNALVQLRFPILKGVSQTQAYRAATLKGAETFAMSEASGLVLKQPEQLGLKIHPSLAGAIPILLPANREDFVALVRALTKRNEPTPIPDSMGACMVGGYSNWDRIHRYRRQWTENNSHNSGEAAWKEEFGRLTAQKNLYQDRFIILSNGFYSNILPQQIDLPETTWRDLSLTIRLEHECTHYFTRRLLNSMRNNLLDELIADYRGIVAATGSYRADWFLRFMGLESFPDLRANGRIHNYQGETTLSKHAFTVLQSLVKAAAENIEHFDRYYRAELSIARNQPLMLIALTRLTLEELASDQAFEKLQTTFLQLQNESLRFSVVN